MELKKLRGTTPSRRHMTGLNWRKILNPAGRPLKRLLRIIKKKSGRDNRGHISVRHQGGGEKRFYRVIDWKRDKFNVVGKVISLEYDPNRTANIALISYADGDKRYIIAPSGLKVGDEILSAEETEVKSGNVMPLKNIPLGVVICAVELFPGRGAQLARSAGASAIILSKEEKYVVLKLQSGEVRKVLGECRAMIGVISNEEKKNIILGKAGRKRHMGVRPSVRGVAQDPRSHPHGGGEGRSGIGLKKGPKTPWGKQAFHKTRNKRRLSEKLIISHRKP